MRVFLTANQTPSRRARLLTLTSLFILCMSGNVRASGEPVAASSARRPIRLFVAASLADVADAMVAEYQRAHHEEVLLHRGGSGALVRQIELGAACDIFISADPHDIDSLELSGVTVLASRMPAGNTLVLAARADSHTTDRTGSVDWKGITRLAIGHPDYSPAGRYARQALSNIRLDDASAWETLLKEGKLVFADNVQQAARHAAVGSVDAAIVYATDVTPESGLTTLHTFDAAHHDDIAYAAALLPGHQPNATTEPTAAPTATILFDFLSGDQAAAIWQRFGFVSRSSAATVAAPAKISSPSGVGRDGVIANTIASHAGDGGFLQVVGLSVLVSIVAVILMLVPGVLLAIWLARTRSPWRPIVELVVVAPLVLPPVVTGFALLSVLLWLKLPLPFTWGAAVLAAMVVALPLLVRTVRASVEQIDPRLTGAAQTLGAGPFRALRTITLPLAWRGIVGGATLAWARSLGEFGATIVVAGNLPGRTTTLPLAIWTNIQTPGAATPWALIGTALLLSLLAVGVGERLARTAGRSHARA